MKSQPPISRQVIYRGHHDGYSLFDVPTNSDSLPPYPHARLIAAAPDLLAALEAAEKALAYCACDPLSLHPMNNSQVAVAMNALPDIRAAIAKVKG